MSLPASLTIVLPAFNEADRIGPALDELFGYLRRRGERARDGAPGAAGLPEQIEVLVVDDGSTDATAALVGARRRRRSRTTRRPAAAPDGPARRQGGGGPRRDAGRDRGPDRVRRRRHGDAAGPAAAAGAALHDHDVALGSRIQPDGRTCARPSRCTGGCSARSSTCWPRSGWSAPSRTPSAGSRGSPGRPRTTCSRASGSPASSSTSSSSTSPAVAATRWRSCRSAGSTGAGRACAPGPAWPSASPGTCSGSRSSIGGAARRRAARMTGDHRHEPRPARAGGAPDRRHPLVRAGVGVGLAAAGDTLGFDFLAYYQAARRLLDGSPSTTSTSGDRGVRAVLLPADLRPPDPAVRRSCPRRRRSWRGRRS